MPPFYVQHRPVGTEKWSDPSPFIDHPSVRDAMERADGLTAIEADGIVKGRMTEWRLVRHGVVIHAWRQDGRP